MQQPEYTDGVPTPQRYWAILTIGIAVTMAVMDTAIANIALPAIARDVHASPSDSIWVVNAYQLAVVISLLPLASLGEIYGFRRVYQVGLVVFTLASLACALSSTLTALILARVLQGLAAAGIMSVNSALTRFVYPRAMLGRGMAINALVSAVSSAAGPTIAAAILAVGPWEWLFAINVPLGLVAIAIAWKSLPLTPRAGHRFDLPSAIMNALAFGLLIISIDGLAHHQPLPAVILELLTAIIFGYLLVQRQRSRTAPLLPVDLLRIPIFRMSVATSICSFTAQMLAFVSLPFFLQDVLGRDAVQTGLLMTPWPVMTAVIAPVAGRLADRHSAGLLGGIGLAAFAVGLALLAILPAAAGSADVAWRMAVCGLGFGLFQSPNNRAIVAAAPRHRSGGAAGMLGTSRLLGQTLGASFAALLFTLSSHGTTLALIGAAAIASGASAVSWLRVIPHNVQT